MRPHIRVYPEIPDGPVTEIWHAEKWHKEMDLRLLSPMYADGSRHYYVLEFARLKNGDFVIPARWLTHKGRVKADVFQVEKFPDGTVSINTSQTARIDASELWNTYPELVDHGLVPVCRDGKFFNCFHAILFTNKNRQLKNDVGSDAQP